MSLKIMVVGQENVGKTSLIAGFKIFVTNGGKNYKRYMQASGGLYHGTTEGIKMESFQLTTEQDPKKQVNIKIWDFAGLEVYQSTHSFFLTERSIYIIVWNINADPESSRVTYWLKTIRFNAPKSPIMLVATHLDTVYRKKKEKVRLIRESALSNYKKKYEQISSVHGVGVPTGVGMKEFVASLSEKITLALQPYLKQPEPHASRLFAKALLAIRNHKGSSQWRILTPVCEWSTMEKIFERCRVPNSERQNALRYAEEIGVCVYCRGSEARPNDNGPPGFVILNPEWITEMFASIISSRSDVKNGILDMEKLKSQIWKPPQIPATLHPQLLRVLEGFGIVFPFPDGKKVLIPSLLSDTIPNLQSIWPAHNPHTVQFTRLYQFNFIPPGLFDRLLVRCLSTLTFKLQYWGNGVIIDNDESLCYISYQQHMTKITLSARSKTRYANPVVLFSTVSEFFDHLLEHQFSIVPRIFLPCPVCIAAQLPQPTLFTKKECETAAAKNQSSITCTKISNDPHEIPIYHIAPDIAMIDFENRRINVEKDVIIQNKIGEGAFAVVFKGLFNSRVVAVKKMNLSVAAKTGISDVLAQFRREIRVMSRLKHENLVELIGFSMADPMAMITEYCEFGDLYTYLHGPDKKLIWPFKLRIGLDMARAMNFLHSIIPPLIHRDLKSPNVMICSEEWHAPVVAKIADFGLSKELLTENFKAVKPAARDVANPTWLAPEVMSQEVSGKPVDVYSYGIILWEILTRKHPFSNFKYTFKQEEAIKKGERPPIPNDCPYSYKKLIESCWHQEPYLRPDFHTITERLLPMAIAEIYPEFSLSVDRQKSTQETAKIRRSSETNFPASNIINRPRSIRPPLRRLNRNASPSITAFKPKTSINIINRWKPGVSQTLGRGRLTMLRKIDNTLLYCPSPAELSDLEWRELTMELESDYKDHYKVYNLSGIKYDYAMFESIVVEYPMEELIPPVIAFYQEIIHDIMLWLKQDKDNTALIHCGGKDCHRSGLVLAGALLMANKVPDHTSALDIIEKYLYTRLRIPSYIRYVRYFAHGVISGFPTSSKKVYLHKMRFNSIPNFKLIGGCDPHYCIHQNGKKIYFSKKLKGRKEKDPVEFFCGNLAIGGDIRIEFYHKSFSKMMFSVTINTSFEDLSETYIIFRKEELDKACNDTKHFNNNFQLELYYLHEEQIKKVRAKSERKKAAITGNDVQRVTQKRREGNYFPKKVIPDPQTRDICHVCKLPITDDQVSIEVIVGIVMHYSCMSCGQCGRSLHDDNLQSLVRGDRVICQHCDTSFFTECTKCNKNIFGTVVKIGDRSWHTNCFSCGKCGISLWQKQYLVKKTHPYCEQCGRTVQEHEIPAHHPKTAEEDELEVLLLEPIGKDYFGKSLNTHNVKNLLEFWELVNERKQYAAKKREQLANNIIEQYLQSTGSSALPENILKQIEPITDISALGCFDKAQSLVFSEMASYYGPFSTSGFYNEYLDAIRTIPDTIEKQDAIRRENAAEFFPIDESDLLPAEQVALKLVREDRKNKAINKATILQIHESLIIMENLREPINTMSHTILSLSDIVQKSLSKITEIYDSHKNSRKIYDEFREVAMDQVTQALEASEILKTEVAKIPGFLTEITAISKKLRNLDSPTVDKKVKHYISYASKLAEELTATLNTSNSEADKINANIKLVESKTGEILRGGRNISPHSSSASKVRSSRIKSTAEELSHTKGMIEIILECMTSALLTLGRSVRQIRSLRELAEDIMSSIKELSSKVKALDDENALVDTIKIIAQHLKAISEKTTKATATSTIGRQALQSLRSSAKEVLELVKNSQEAFRPEYEKSRDICEKAIKAQQTLDLELRVISDIAATAQKERDTSALYMRQVLCHRRVREAARKAADALQLVQNAYEAARKARQAGDTSVSIQDVTNLLCVAEQHAKIASQQTDVVATAAEEGSSAIQNVILTREAETTARDMIDSTAGYLKEARDLTTRAKKEVNNISVRLQQLKEVEERQARNEAQKKMIAILPTCYSCQKKIMPGQRFVVNSPNYYHSECFLCVKCKIILDNSQYVVDGDEIWCLDDFKTYKALKCGTCMLAILDANFLRLSDSCYHRKCLICIKCSKNLEEISFYLIDNCPYCTECVEK